MIFAKNLKEKRLLFILLMILEEVLLTRIFKYTIWLQVSYTALTYIILKILYKEKAQITDVFTFMIGSLILFVLSGISYGIIFLTSKQFSVAVIVSRLLMLLFLILFRRKLPNIQRMYKKLWNRNDGVKKKIKSTTFRCINLVAFNLMFCIANIIFVYVFYRQGGV